MHILILPVGKLLDLEVWYHRCDTGQDDQGVHCDQVGDQCQGWDGGDVTSWELRVECDDQAWSLAGGAPGSCESGDSWHQRNVEDKTDISKHGCVMIPVDKTSCQYLIWYLVEIKSANQKCLALII